VRRVRGSLGDEAPRGILVVVPRTIDRTFAAALCRILDGRLVERTQTPGGDTDGLYIETAHAGPAGCVRLVRDRDIHVVRTDLEPPRSRWVSIRSERPPEGDLWAADDDEAYVLVGPDGAEVVQAPMYRDEQALLDRIPPAACRRFLALQDAVEHRLTLVLERYLGAWIGAFEVNPGEPDSVRALVHDAAAVLAELR